MISKIEETSLDGVSLQKTYNENLIKKKQVDEVEKSFKKMELDIRQNNELIMDINSDKERVTV